MRDTLLRWASVQHYQHLLNQENPNPQVFPQNPVFLWDLRFHRFWILLVYTIPNDLPEIEIKTIRTWSSMEIVVTKWILTAKGHRRIGQGTFIAIQPKTAGRAIICTARSWAYLTWETRFHKPTMTGDGKKTPIKTVVLGIAYYCMNGVYSIPCCSFLRCGGDIYHQSYTWWRKKPYIVFGGLVHPSFFSVDIKTLYLPYSKNRSWNCTGWWF